jgi:polysaccharide export outer membrane protein
MKTNLKRFWRVWLFSFASLLFPCQLAAQQSGGLPFLPSDAQQVKEGLPSGQITPEQVQEGMRALEQGQISPEQIKALQEKSAGGSLTPAEIEAGRKILEQQQKTQTTQPVKPQTAVPQKQPPPAEKESAEPSPAEVKAPEELADESFFKKPAAEQRPDLAIFGRSLFDNPPSTFAPVQNVPVSDTYIIGPGDEIKVLMWGRIEANYTLEVNNEGLINFPKLGPMAVAGLSFADLKLIIARQAEAITGVNVSVSMGRLRTIQVFVLGEAISPGVYTVSSLATVTNALLAAGGPTRLGSLRKVQLKRQGQLVATIDLYDFLLQGDMSADTRLMTGDVIFIPQAGQMVSVYGNVKRPAIYELADDKSLQEALRLAGGLAPRAYSQRLQIERAFQNRYEVVLDVNVEELGARKRTVLADGDMIRIFSILSTAVNSVFLYGNVTRPGQYAFKPNLRLRDVLPDLKTLGVDTYLDYALVKRYRIKDMKTELLPFNLGDLLIKGDPTQNLALAPSDEIYVFNKSMFLDRASALIKGEVRKPGRYTIDNMRLKDLFFKAGLFTPNAYMDIGHLYRTDLKTKEVKMLTFNLNKVMTEDPDHNVALERQDEVVVHSVLEFWEKHSVSVNGMVNKPGEYPLVTDMTVKDLVLVAGNIKKTAYTDEAELVRYDILEGKDFHTAIIKVNLAEALKDNDAHNMKLQPMDALIVKGIPQWYDRKKTVRVSGEIRFPGSYQIRTDEKLSDVIERAGGYTEKAYLRGSVFTRESARHLQQQRINEMLQRLEADVARMTSAEVQAALTREDLAAQSQFLSAQKVLIQKLRETKATGRVVVSLQPVGVLRGSHYDMVLEDGDVIDIPKRPDTVAVLGAVYNPTSIMYDERRPEVKHYLAKTGGPTENAESKSMYIVTAAGTVISKSGSSSVMGIDWDMEKNRWTFGSSFEETKLYPGDTVLVPEMIYKPSFWKEIKDVTEVLYQIAVVAGITIQMFD